MRSRGTNSARPAAAETATASAAAAAGTPGARATARQPGLD
ncbi:MAG TPA: hypothetical protein VEG38_21175 [Acidimicrobiia bacterium]|nr:hypothetical protein [Acidimicrobiia bacterium]